MRSNLAEVAAQLTAGLLAPCQAAASGELVTAIATDAAARGQELLTEEFAARTAPSGAPWLPPAHDYGHPLLDASGALKSSGTCEIGPRDDASGFQLTFKFTDEKAPWQHFGTKRGGISNSGTRRKSGATGAPAAQHIPPRPLLPTEGEADRWRADLESTMQTSLDSWLASRVHV